MGASMSLTSGSCGSLTSSSTLMPMSSRYLSRSSLGIITFRLQRLSSCPRLRLRRLGGRLVAAQEPVLEYLHQHRYHEVQEHTRGEADHDEDEHEVDEHLLPEHVRVGAGREPRLGQHHGHVGGGQDVERVGHAQVGQPQEAFRELEVDEHPPQDDEQRHLQDDGQTAARRVDARLLVELHRLLGELLAVVLVLLLQRLQLRLQLLHAQHRLRLGSNERPDQHAEAEGKHDDRETPGTHELVDVAQYPDDPQGEAAQDVRVEEARQVGVPLLGVAHKLVGVRVVLGRYLDDRVLLRSQLPLHGDDVTGQRNPRQRTIPVQRLAPAGDLIEAQQVGVARSRRPHDDGEPAVAVVRLHRDVADVLHGRRYGIEREAVALANLHRRLVLPGYAREGELERLGRFGGLQALGADGVLERVGDAADPHDPLDAQLLVLEEEAAFVGGVVKLLPVGVDHLKLEVLAIEQGGTAGDDRTHRDEVLPVGEVVRPQVLPLLLLAEHGEQFAGVVEEEVGTLGGDAGEGFIQVGAPEGGGSGGGAGLLQVVGIPELVDRELVQAKLHLGKRGG